MNARQRRREKALLEKSRSLSEYRSFDGQAVTVTCPNGHTNTRSRSHYDDKRRVVAVTWTCAECEASYKNAPYLKRRNNEADTGQGQTNLQ